MLKRVAPYANRLSLIAALSALLIAVLYLLLLVFFGFDRDPMLYWLVLWSNISTVSLGYVAFALFMTPIVVLFASSILSALSKRPFDRPNRALLLFMVVSLFLCSGAFAGFLQAGFSEITDIQTTVYHENVYHLLFYHDEPMSYDFYHLYECVIDSISFVSEFTPFLVPILT